MSRFLALLAGAVAAVTLTACGNVNRPLAGSLPRTTTTAGRAKIDDPRTAHITCLREHGFNAHALGLSDIQIGSRSTGPYVHYEPSPGAAQQQQIEGLEQGAEVIGSALLYPRDSTGAKLTAIEDCVAKNVLG